MNGWVKLFADGTKELGTDEDVKRKLASWSRGKLINMIGSEIYQDNIKMAIEGLGPYWQSDDYDVSFMESTPSMVIRRLQKQITKDDAFWMCNVGLKTFKYIFLSLQEQQIYAGNTDPVPKEWVGKWFTVTLDLKQRTCLFSIEESKI